MADERCITAFSRRMRSVSMTSVPQSSPFGGTEMWPQDHVSGEMAYANSPPTNASWAVSNCTCLMLMLRCFARGGGRGGAGAEQAEGKECSTSNAP